jgi:predicted metal-dependent hydrolase
MVAAANQTTMKQKVAEGIHLFNTRKFFEAHEALEEVWLKAEGNEKIFLHGLIQVAAAFHHHSTGNLAGFRSLLDKGMRKLNQFGDMMEEVDLESLREQIQPWREHLAGTHHSRPAANLALPKVRVKK